ncbi:MAG: carboxypeptidase-like regulatory domain-containing protein [Planctomycetota bacterium]|jgi:hypothetical protein
MKKRISWILAALVLGISLGLFILWRTQDGMPGRIRGSPGPAPAPPSPSKSSKPILPPLPCDPATSPSPPTPKAPAPLETPAGTPRIRGRVEKEEGKTPLKGVRVVLVLPRKKGKALPGVYEAFDTLASGIPASWAAVLSGEGGAFEITPREPGPYLLLVRHPGYREAWEKITGLAESPRSGLVIVLRKEGVVRGRVIDGDLGTGMGGITVEGHQLGMGKNWWDRPRSTVTEPDGSFFLRGFVPALVDLKPRFDEETRPYGRDFRESWVVRTDGPEVELRLYRTGTVIFNGVDASTLRPLDVPIRGKDTDRDLLEEVAVNIVKEAPGRFLLKTIRGARDIELTAEGYFPLTVRFRVPSLKRLPHGEILRFRRGACIVGTLSLEKEEERGTVEKGNIFVEPLDVKDAVIRFTSPKRSGPAIGKYVAGPLSPGRYRLVALAPGFQPESIVIRVRDRDVTHHFRLRVKTAAIPPPQARYAFRDRRKMKMGLDLKEIPLPEVVEWLVEVTGADIHIRAGSLDGCGRDEIWVMLKVEEIPLDELVNLITMLKGLKFDPETGVISR